MGETLARSLRISNRKLRAASSFVPRYGSARAGWKAAPDSFEAPVSHDSPPHALHRTG